MEALLRLPVFQFPSSIQGFLGSLETLGQCNWGILIQISRQNFCIQIGSRLRVIEVVVPCCCVHCIYADSTHKRCHEPMVVPVSFSGMSLWIIEVPHKVQRVFSAGCCHGRSTKSTCKSEESGPRCTIVVTTKILTWAHQKSLTAAAEGSWAIYLIRSTQKTYIENVSIAHLADESRRGNRAWFRSVSVRHPFHSSYVRNIWHICSYTCDCRRWWIWCG